MRVTPSYYAHNFIGYLVAVVAVAPQGEQDGIDTCSFHLTHSECLEGSAPSLKENNLDPVIVYPTHRDGLSVHTATGLN